MLTDFDNDFHQPLRMLNLPHIHINRQRDRQTHRQTKRRQIVRQAGRTTHSFLRKVMRSRPTWARSSLKTTTTKNKKLQNNKQRNKQRENLKNGFKKSSSGRSKS